MTEKQVPHPSILIHFTDLTAAQSKRGSAITTILLSRDTVRSC